MTSRLETGKPGDGVRRLGLRRPARRARARPRGLARARRGAPARPRRPPAADGGGRPDPARAGQPALSRLGAPGGRGGAGRGEPGRHPGQGRARRPSRRVHVAGARAVAEAARDAGVGTLVHVSALGADKRAKSNYARSKAAGEAAVLQEFPGAVILRPSLVFGPEDELFNRFANMAAHRAAPAADRRRPHEAAAGLRRRRRRRHRRRLRRQGRAGGDLRAGRAGDRDASASCSTRARRGPAASAPICACPSGRPSSARCSPCRCRTACGRSPSTRSACCSATTW